MSRLRIPQPKHSSSRQATRSPHVRQSDNGPRQRAGSRARPLPDRPAFDAPERWYDPREQATPRIVVSPPGLSYLHAVTATEIRDRLSLLPDEFQTAVQVVRLSPMTRKRQLFPCYGLQWGTTVYLYPVESSLVERFLRAPLPQQRIEAEMYGGQWGRDGQLWTLTWTLDTLRDFYLNNILMHEVGHAVDTRNTRPVDRERYANWFAIEYGYRWSRGRT